MENQLKLETFSSLKYSAKIASTEVLGPGKRAVIWVHGCCFDCDGCLAENFKKGPYREEPTMKTVEWLLSLNDCDGITISGGEPFLQAEPLAEVIEMVKMNRDMGVIIYTGFTLEELKAGASEDQSIDRLLNLTDILIDGRYVDKLNDGRPYRGSSNQRIIALSSRYSEEMHYYEDGVASRSIEIRLLPDAVMMVGVPDREQLTLWNEIKRMGEEYGGNQY